MTAPDVLVFLSSPDTIGAKTHTPAGTSDYNIPVGPFAVTRVAITSFADLADALSSCPLNAYHVRGETIDLEATSIPYRRTNPKRLDDGTVLVPTLRAALHRVIPIDFDTDKKSTQPPMSDLFQAALEARAILPPPLNTATCVAMATSNAGVLPGTRVRLWYLGDRTISDPELKSWLARTPSVDASIFAAYQPIYCAAPRFIGCEDPFPRRMVVLPGEDLVLPASTEAATPLEHSPQQALLVASATNPYRLTEGNRNNALAKKAGLMRRHGFPQEAITAALQQLNALECSPPLAEDEVARIAGSIAGYAPAVAVSLPKDDKRAAKELAAQAKRVAQDPDLRGQALSAMRPHLESGALTANQIVNAVQAALRKHHIDVPAGTLHTELAVAPPPADTVRDGWQLGLSIDSTDGSIRKSPANLAHILRHHDAFSLWHDSRAEQAMWSKCPWGRAGFALTDTDGSRLKEWFDTNMGWIQLPEEPWDAMRKVAEETKADPWLHYLEQLHWDGQARFAHAVSALFGGEDRAERTCFAWWMISSVARSYQPGCQVDYMIVLEGDQGVGKSSFLQELVGAPRYYSRISTSGDLSNPRVTGKLQGPVVIEIAELSALNKRDVEQTKDFLDNREDKWQRLYGRTVEMSPRKVVFAGTTNKSTYLQDVTGARRFWPIRVRKQIDIRLVRQLRDQLWAEAVHYYKQGVKWYPTTEQAIELGLLEAQEERREAEAGEDEITHVLNMRHAIGLTTADCPPCEAWMLNADGYIVAAPNKWLRALLRNEAKGTHQITKVMTAVGWRQIKRRTPNPLAGKFAATERVWYRPGFEPESKQAPT